MLVLKALLASATVPVTEMYWLFGATAPTLNPLDDSHDDTLFTVAAVGWYVAAYCAALRKWA